MFVDKNSSKKPKTTMCGWELLIALGETEGYQGIIPHVQLAECAVVNKILEEPMFAWWVPYTIQIGTGSFRK
jgi:hypothetical protein